MLAVFIVNSIDTCTMMAFKPDANYSCSITAVITACQMRGSNISYCISIFVYGSAVIHITYIVLRGYYDYPTIDINTSFVHLSYHYFPFICTTHYKQLVHYDYSEDYGNSIRM